MRLRRWYTGGAIPPYKPSDDRIPVVLSPWIDTETWDECHLHTDAELERLVTSAHLRQGLPGHGHHGRRWGGLRLRRVRTGPTAALVASRAEVAAVTLVEFLTARFRHDPARVLADVEAKRRIVDLHGAGPHECVDWDEALGETCTCYEVDCPTLRLLALPYDTHPDYQEEWRP